MIISYNHIQSLCYMIHTVSNIFSKAKADVFPLRTGIKRAVKRVDKRWLRPGEIEVAGAQRLLGCSIENNTENMVTKIW